MILLRSPSYLRSFRVRGECLRSLRRFCTFTFCMTLNLICVLTSSFGLYLRIFIFPWLTGEVVYVKWAIFRRARKLSFISLLLSLEYSVLAWCSSSAAAIGDGVADGRSTCSWIWQSRFASIGILRRRSFYFFSARWWFLLEPYFDTSLKRIFFCTYYSISPHDFSCCSWLSKRRSCLWLSNSAICWRKVLIDWFETEFALNLELVVFIAKFRLLAEFSDS